MKNQISTLAVAVLLFSSVFVMGQTRDVGSFDAIHVSTSVTVTLIKANSPSIEYTMIKGNERNLITEVKNRTLYVKTKSGKGNWSNNTQADVTVYYVNLDDVSASAGCTVKSDNTIKASDMDIDVSSGSTVRLDVQADELDVDVSSGSTLKIKGSAGKVDIQASSGSSMKAFSLEVDDADIDASSGSSVSIHVNNKLEAEASSGASINYTGSVKNTDIDSGWSGSIKRKG